jgi:hypothetical protein
MLADFRAAAAEVALRCERDRTMKKERRRVRRRS